MKDTNTKTITTRVDKRVYNRYQDEAHSKKTNVSSLIRDKIDAGEKNQAIMSELDTVKQQIHEVTNQMSLVVDAVSELAIAVKTVSQKNDTSTLNTNDTSESVSSNVSSTLNTNDEHEIITRLGLLEERQREHEQLTRDLLVTTPSRDNPERTPNIGVIVRQVMAKVNRIDKVMSNIGETVE